MALALNAHKHAIASFSWILAAGTVGKYTNGKSQNYELKR